MRPGCRRPPAAGAARPSGPLVGRDVLEAAVEDLPQVPERLGRLLGLAVGALHDGGQRWRSARPAPRCAAGGLHLGEHRRGRGGVGLVQLQRLLGRRLTRRCMSCAFSRVCGEQRQHLGLARRRPPSAAARAPSPRRCSRPAPAAAARPAIQPSRPTVLLRAPRPTCSTARGLGEACRSAEWRPRVSSDVHGYWVFGYSVSSLAPISRSWEVALLARGGERAVERLLADVVPLFSSATLSRPSTTSPVSVELCSASSPSASARLCGQDLLHLGEEAGRQREPRNFWRRLLQALEVVELPQRSRARGCPPPARPCARVRQREVGEELRRLRVLAVLVVGARDVELHLEHVVGLCG